MKLRIINKEILKKIIFNQILLIFYLFPFFAGFILYYFNNNFSFCLLINLVHLPCPLCGLSRSFINLTHLKFIEAMQYNFMIVIIAPLLIFLIMIRLFNKKIKVKIYLFMLDKLNFLNNILILYILILFLFGIIRILDVYFQFIGFKDIVPEVTFLKVIFKFIKNIGDRALMLNMI